MRLLDRYLLRELLVPLGFCLGGFLVFWIASDMFTQLSRFQENHLLGRDVAEYYLVSVPEFLVLVLPVALLLALLYTLTNHARHNEVTAMRAAGVSLRRISLPYVLVGLVFSLALFAMNEFWVPDGAERAELILQRRNGKASAATAAGKEIQLNLPFQNERDGRAWMIGSFNMKTGVMIDPKVDWHLPDGSRRWLAAHRGEYRDGVWTFYDAEEYRAEAGSDAGLKPYVQTNLLAAPEFTETPDQIRREVKVSHRLSVGQKSVKSAEIPILEILDYLDLHRHLSDQNRWWLQTQLHDRMAKPWTCLIAVLMAIPFGAASGRRNVFVGVAGSIVIFFVYYVLQKVGLAMGMGGRLPPWLAAWLPNGAFALFASWMLLRVK